MLRIFFWNIASKDTSETLREICRLNEPTLLCLAEPPHNGAQTENIHKSLHQLGYRHEVNLPSFINHYHKIPPNRFTPIFDGKDASFRRIHISGLPEITLAAVHLPSKLHYSSSEQMLAARRFADDIERVEHQENHDRTIVVGDFNMDPFDEGMIASDTFHAVMDETVARRGSRTVRGETKKFFYNPMWSRLGDKSVGPPGTYAFSRGFTSYFWHTFDQILVRPSLLPFFSEKNVHVIESVGTERLYDKEKVRIVESDHLPLLVELGATGGR